MSGKEYCGYPILTDEILTDESGIIPLKEFHVENENYGNYVKVKGLPDRGFDYCFAHLEIVGGPYDGHLIIGVMGRKDEMIVVPTDKVSHIYI
jgi:hypothetical protein